MSKLTPKSKIPKRLDANTLKKIKATKKSNLTAIAALLAIQLREHLLAHYRLHIASWDLKDKPKGSITELNDIIYDFQRTMGNAMFNFTTFEDVIDTLAQLTYILPLHLNIPDANNTPFAYQLYELTTRFFGVAQKIFQLESYPRDNIAPQTKFSFPIEDAIDIYFYESFLSHYKKVKLKQQGVYYTPNEASSFIYHTAVNHLQKQWNIDLNDSDEYLILDFAAGTGALIRPFITQAPNAEIQQFRAKNILAFENDITSLLIGRYSLECTLQQSFHGYLYVNPLNPKADFLQWLLTEVQNKTLIIIGNPPYKGISGNNSLWIENLINDYKYVNGQHFNERKNWLNDDYVKFIRLGQKLISHAKQGAMLVVSNHSYLDNPTFRGMRYQLASVFDAIDVIDLHGSNKKKTPLESTTLNFKDENIFGIETGIAISIMTRKESKLNTPKNIPASADKAILNNIRYFEIKGEKGTKLDWLANARHPNMEFATVCVDEPYYFFTPLADNAPKHYNQFPSIRNIFKNTNVGVITARDGFCIDINKDILLTRILELADAGNSNEYLINRYHLKDTSTFSLNKARKSLQALSLEELKSYIIPIAYRPWDIRWIFYHKDVVERRVFTTQRLLLVNQLSPSTPEAILNPAIVFQRGCSSNEIMNRPQITTHIIDHGFSYPSNRAVSYIAPLYYFEENSSFPPPQHTHIPASNKPQFEQHNFTPLFANELCRRLNIEFNPASAFAYIYGVLNSPIYLSRYSAYLKADFPNIPYPASIEIYEAIAKIGQELMRIQLFRFRPAESDWIMQNKLTLSHPRRTIEVSKLLNQAVYINKDTAINRLTALEYHFEIGGYMAIKKYLTARKYKELSSEDLLQLTKMKFAIHQTLKLQSELIKLTESWI